MDVTLMTALEKRWVTADTPESEIQAWRDGFCAARSNPEPQPVTDVTLPLSLMCAGASPEIVELIEQTIHAQMNSLHDRLKHLHREPPDPISRGNQHRLCDGIQQPAKPA